MAIPAWRCWLEDGTLEMERTTWAHNDCVELDVAPALLRLGHVVIVAGGDLESLRATWANDGEPTPNQGEGD